MDFSFTCVRLLSLHISRLLQWHSWCLSGADECAWYGFFSGKSPRIQARCTKWEAGH